MSVFYLSMALVRMTLIRRFGEYNAEGLIRTMKKEKIDVDKSEEFWYSK